MIRLSITASLGAGPEDEPGSRDYSVILDGVSGVTEVRFGDVAGKGSIGLLSLTVAERMESHTVNLSFTVGSPWGDRLKANLLVQDMVKVEARTKAGTWDLLFWGFVSQADWNREGGPGAYTHRCTLTAEGAHRLLYQGWENWQGAISAADGKLGVKGIDFAQKVIKEECSLPPESLIRRMLTTGIGALLKFRSGGTTIDGSWWGFGTWKSDFNFTVHMAKAWYLQQQGPLMSILQSLVEPEIHEFFLTYADGRPSWVFRPKPFPGHEADPDRWSSLPVVRLGVRGGPPGAVGVRSVRQDGQRATAWHWASATSSLGSADNLYGKALVGFWVDRPRVAKYGYAAHQITTNLPGASPTWLPETPRAIVRRVAWQDAPVPWLEMQTRSYPWLASRLSVVPHVGQVLEDSTDGPGNEVTGYITSVQHVLHAQGEGFQASTVLGVERVAVGVAAADYVEHVRGLCSGLEQGDYAGTDRVREVVATISPTAKASPAPAGGSSSAWASPVSGKVTSKVGPRKDPFSGAKSYHRGVDIAAPAGTPVGCPVQGQVVDSGTDSVRGNWVRVKGADGSVHTMAHLQAPTPLARGASVAPGQSLGAVGSTGNSTGPHLHWQAKDSSGAIVNPLSKVK